MEFGRLKAVMKKILILAIALLFPFFADAATLGQKLSGKILLNVEKNGEAWYVYPVNNNRYYLGRPSDAFKVMRELGLGINEIEFQKIAASNMTVDGDLALAKKLAGRIVLQVEKNGEAWYIHPVKLKKYYLGRPSDAFKLMRELSLGITREDLAKIHKDGLSESIDGYSSYERSRLTANGNEYAVDIVKIDLSNPNLKIITDTSDDYNCETDCKADTLAHFVLKNNAFAGINGTYFDTGTAKKNYYFFPVYNTALSKMINEDELKYWTTGPIMAFDENNKFYYFKDSREFKGVNDFESKYGVKLQAAIGNKPRLIENGMNLLIDWDIDEKQLKTKALRNAIAYKDGFIYLVIAENATVPDLADIMKALKVEYALNLDGGYSSALYYNDEYMVSPGRNIPNAILFSEN